MNNLFIVAYALISKYQPVVRIQTAYVLLYFTGARGRGRSSEFGGGRVENHNNRTEIFITFIESLLYFHEVVRLYISHPSIKGSV